MKAPILITHESPPFRGGVATYCHELCQAMNRLGVSMELWSPYQFEADYPRRQLKCGARLHPWDVFCMAKELVRHADILEGRTVLLASYGAHLAALVLSVCNALPRANWVSSLYGSEIPRLNRWWLRLFAKCLFDRTAHTIVLSNFTLNLLLQSRFFNPTKPCAVIYGAPSAHALREVEPAASRGGKFRVLTVARIHPRKGQLLTLEGLGALPLELRKKIVYQIAGKGDASYLNQIIQRAEELNVELEVIGSVADEDLARCYAQCDVMVMTSPLLPMSVEGLGLTYLEAAWHGKPCIGYRCGGAVEAIRDGETGFLLEPHQPLQLASAVERLMSDAELYASMSQQAREFARSFTWSRTAQRLKEILGL